jgi:hypothetical protein
MTLEEVNQMMSERTAFLRKTAKYMREASLIVGTRIGVIQKKYENPKEEYERDAREGKQQEKQLEVWAKAMDLWVNDYEDINGNKAKTLEDLLHSQWEYLNMGSEAEVYAYDDTMVLKSINLSHVNDNPSKLLDRITLFNLLFPTTALDIGGFGRDSLGHFRVIVTQPHIEGTELTAKDLEKFHNKYELEQTEEGWFKIEYPNVYITDLSEFNILKDNKGNFHIIDADVKYDTH